jgi:NAD-dependent SIR2 family protein deacetylase
MVKTKNILRKHPALEKIRTILSERTYGIGLFVGAGLSMSAGLKGWKDLLIAMLKDIKECTSEEMWGNIQRMIETKQYTYAAHLLKSYMGEDVYQDRIESELDEQRKLPEGIAKALNECCTKNNIKLIITTNFDRVLEESLNNSEEGKSWLVFTNKQCDRARAEIAKGSNVIFKIHGDIKDLRSIVFTQRDYQELYYRRNDFTFLLANLFDSYTFLFLGFSLKDPFFTTVLDILAGYFGSLKRKHYALLSGTTSADRKAWEDLRGIRIIPYEKEQFDHEKAVLAVIEKLSDIPNIVRISEINLSLTDLEGWRNSGAEPVIVEEGDTKAIKANYTVKNGKRTNCSFHRRIGNIRSGSTVEASVYFKCEEDKYGCIFIGDAGDPDPYDNCASEKKKGTGDWDQIKVEVKYQHDDICYVYLYGNREFGKNGDFVLYKDLKIRIIDP